MGQALNIEAALLCSGELLLLQRGGTRSENLVLRYALDDVLALLRGAGAR